MNLASYFRYAALSWWAIAPIGRPSGNIAVLSTVWPHHARRSGYHPVSKGLGVALPGSMQLLPATISRWIVGQGLERAYQIALAMRISSSDRLLVIDGDFQLKLIEGIRRLTKAKIYAVFHQIPAYLRELLEASSPLSFDGVLCVARCQIPIVEALAPPGRTWFMPHGVDTDYFAPGPVRSDHPTVLCVGVHQRDFEVLRKASDTITRAIPFASGRLIAPRAYLPPGHDLGSVEVVSGLSDAQLREEYQRAWVVLLPLLDSTANNSLLEAMACGAPLVVSDVGGVRDYAGPECGALCPAADAQAHAAAVIELLLQSTRRELAGRAARSRAEICAWPKVRDQIRTILAEYGP